MILSSSDILRILGGSEIIRLSAKLKIVDGKPALSGAEGLFIYIDRFPRTDEFQATWSIYIESDGSEPDDLVLAEIKKLLPSVKVEPGLMTTVTATDFLSANTQRAPEAPKQIQEQVDLTQYEERFQALVEDVQDQMLLVTSGRPGKDGRDGVNGRDGRNGRDIVATETELEDLANVEQGIAKENGQVLTWKDGKWQNLFVPQIVSSISGGGSGVGGTSSVIVSDDPPTERDNGSALEEGDMWWESDTGALYVYYNGAWVQTSGEGGSGVNTLAALLDTDTSGVVDGEILVYRSATGDWTAEPAPDPAQSLGDLTDVNIDPALLEADFGLVYDGTEWVVASPPVLVDGHNQTGVTIPKGTPVYVAGTHSSGKPLLAPADADGAETYPAIGLTHEDFADGVDGHVMLSGILTHVDTSAYSAGDALYLSTTPGVLTNVRPTAANEKVQKVGLVTRVHATAGSILIIGAGRTNDINNELVALIGAGDRNAVDLGTFPGSTINDNVDVKTALQELEGAVDTALQPGDNISTLTNDAGYITSAGAPVQSVAGKTGAVTLVKADITDFSDGDYATAAQGALASTALQPGDNISDLTNDAGYITDPGVSQIVAGNNITISPAGGTGVVTIEATLPVGSGTIDGGNFDTGIDVPDGTATLDGGIFD
jgi:hypothetical protein